MAEPYPKIVIVLGAGASAHTGAPVVANFLSTARELYFRNRGNPEFESFGRVFQAIGKLQGIHSKGQVNLNDIEALYTIFETIESLDIKICESDGKHSLTKDMSILITKTLAYRTKLPITKADYWFSRSPVKLMDERSGLSGYERLIKNIRQISAYGAKVHVISFNYDVAFEVAAQVMNCDVHYGIPVIQSNTAVIEKTARRQTINLLKPHGSLNFFRNKKGSINAALIAPTQAEEEKGSVPIGMEIVTTYVQAAFEELQRAPESLFDDPAPIIIPPTWNKLRETPELLSIWKHSATVLSEADDLIFLGYSLPETDAFFRTFYSVASTGPAPFRSVTVLNKEPPGGVVDLRFRSLLGAGALQVYRYGSMEFGVRNDTGQEDFLSAIAQDGVWKP